MMPARLYHQFFCILVKPSHHWWLCRLQRLHRAKTLSNFSSLCKVCLHCGHSSKITSVHLSSAPPPPPGTLCWGAGDQTPMTSLKLLNCWAGLNWSVRRGSKAGRQHPVVGALISLSLSLFHAYWLPWESGGWLWLGATAAAKAAAPFPFSVIFLLGPHKSPPGMDAVTVYHGKISRETGEKLLLATGLDGSYLLRDSESVPGVYCLCVLWVHCPSGSLASRMSWPCWGVLEGGAFSYSF